MSDEYVQVPPGHKVVMIQPSPQPHFNLLESGFLLLDFGTSGNWRTTLANIETCFDGLDEGQAPTTITILQSEMINELVAANDLDDFLAMCQAAGQRGWSALWILPNEAASNDEVVAGLKRAGFGVHSSARDGTCFVEVHKPDGTITVGMTGPAL
jgi:hypothetical protein